MENKSDQLVKIMLKSGQVINLLAKQETVYQLKNHYNFITVQDEANEICVSIDAIAAFENLNTRKPEPVQPAVEANDQAQPEPTA